MVMPANRSGKRPKRRKVVGMASSSTYDKATGKTTVNPTSYTYAKGKDNARSRGKGKKKGLYK